MQFTLRTMMIAVPLCALLLYSLYSLFVLCGFVPRPQWEIIEVASEKMAEIDPLLRIENYEVTVKRIAPVDYDIHFTHKVTRNRRCIRWRDTFPAGMVEEIECPRYQLL